ncbi:hypothetical protein CLV30_11772 [Haloactinopolyspora alba]|uniref:Uncharacterized protein n=1 Tax=Haloactinopolyspora alba TaxID=648780 RepID=A0A2P8DRD3_9ACTN|nr:hypothetical protein [Haloactinopolyspora alba]PSK99769.1 hypothetical protein CLV30_11772 [Haloactinopolyspora alba]
MSTTYSSPHRGTPPRTPTTYVSMTSTAPLTARWTEHVGRVILDSGDNGVMIQLNPAAAAGLIDQLVRAVAESDAGELAAALRHHLDEVEAEGMSTRAIGSATGMDQATIVRDLQAGDANASPEPTPVTGTDGKTYASRPSEPDVVDAENPDGEVGVHEDAAGDHLRELGGLLAIWSAREIRPQGDDVHPRRAASLAVEEIDATVRTLHDLRDALISQAREYDRESARRTDELLARGGSR